ncbi:MAG: PTS sugar transporter subunit IIC [Lachnospiraceae bacterium]|nr:PTS sugar transporter subunit IIC [Lachnospiraceae bacterium]
MIKKWYDKIFVDGLAGMANGIFVTLIIGTILSQLAGLSSASYAKYVVQIADVLKILMGAGIGIGMAAKYKQGPMVSICGAIAGMIGSYAQPILSTDMISSGKVVFEGAGEPLGAFIAAFVALQVGQILNGKTPFAAFLTPLVSIFLGGAAGLWIGHPISQVMARIGVMITWATGKSPFVMGICVAALMGLVFTLPLSATALAISLNLNGLAGGAALIGCCTHMIGFAVIGIKDNNIGGFLAQAVGTSKLQLPNIMKKMLILIPTVVASGIMGPISTCIFRITCGPEAAGIGNTAFLGPVMAYRDMVANGRDDLFSLIEIFLVCFVLPAVVTKFIAKFLVKDGVIKGGDFKLHL